MAGTIQNAMSQAITTASVGVAALTAGKRAEEERKEELAHLDEKLAVKNKHILAQMKARKEVEDIRLAKEKQRTATERAKAKASKEKIKEVRARNRRTKVLMERTSQLMMAKEGKKDGEE